MAHSKTDPWEAQRASFLRVALFQQALRRGMEGRRSEEGIPLGTLAARLGSTWTQLAPFLANEKAVTAKLSSFDACVAYATGYSKLATEDSRRLGEVEEIKALMRGMSDRKIGSTLLSAEALSLVLDIHQARERQASCPVNEPFARAFRERSEIIAGVLDWRIEASRSLEDPEVAQPIRSILQDERALTAEISAILEEHHARIERTRAEIHQFLRQLGHPSYRDLALRLGEVDCAISPSALSVVMGSRHDYAFSLELMDAVHAGCRALIPKDSPQLGEVSSPQGVSIKPVTPPGSDAGPIPHREVQDPEALAEALVAPLGSQIDGLALLLDQLGIKLQVHQRMLIVRYAMHLLRLARPDQAMLSQVMHGVPADSESMLHVLLGGSATNKRRGEV